MIWDEKRKGQTTLISLPRPVKSLHIGNCYFIFLITVLGIEFQKDCAFYVTIWSSCTSFLYKYCSCDLIVVLGTKGGELYNCELIQLWVDGSMTAEQLDVRFLITPGCISFHPMYLCIYKYSSLKKTVSVLKDCFISLTYQNHAVY